MPWWSGGGGDDEGRDRRDAVDWRRSYNRVLLLLSMSDGDDSAALWKVNRTIHELVKDRVQQCLP